MLRLSRSKVTRPLYLSQSSSERVLEFGIDLADDARCFQLVREGSKTVPLGPKDCIT
ncbi:hypothetical protein ABIE35_002946 [Paenarthrobacter sp. 4246]